MRNSHGKFAGGVRCACRRGSAAAALAVVGWLTAGCAAQPPSDTREVRLGDNLNIYDMYDNSRDWGPSFLIGPPLHYDGDQTRIDDTRLVPRLRNGGAADPAMPPQAAAPDSIMAKPLPAVP